MKSKMTKTRQLRRLTIVVSFGLVLIFSAHRYRLRLDHSYPQFTTLHNAVRYGNVESVERLLESGVDPNDFDPDRTISPLRKAFSSLARSEAERLEIVGLLLAHGADPNYPGGSGDREIHYAAQGPWRGPKYSPEYRAGLIRLLVQFGANPKARDLAGRTPLHRSIQQGTPTRRYTDALVRALLELGADPNAEDLSGSTPLYAAVATKTFRGIWNAYDKPNLEAVRTLLEFGANPNHVGKGGKWPFGAALQRGQKDVLKEFGAAGIDFSGRNSRGESLLEHVVYVYPLREQLKAGGGLEALVEYGLDINTRGANGETFLHMAVLVTDTELCELALSLGADRSIRNDVGFTALELAKDLDKSNLVALLSPEGEA